MRRDDTIRSKIAEHGIKYLLHFTQVENLPTVVAHGILSRHDLIAQGLTPYASDWTRLDKEDRAVSVSISSYNYEMFQAKRYRWPNATWIILALDPSILWKLDCWFYSSNAASGYYRKARRSFGTTSAFLEVFEDACPFGRYRGASYRDENGIPPSCPTRPDAEVQVFEKIALDFIRGAWVEEHELGVKVRAELNKLPGAERNVCIESFNEKFWVGNFVWGLCRQDPGKKDPASAELREIYDEYAHEDGAPAYLSDGVWLHPDGRWEE
jgi:hypothetical protein